MGVGPGRNGAQPQLLERAEYIRQWQKTNRERAEMRPPLPSIPREDFEPFNLAVLAGILKRKEDRIQALGSRGSYLFSLDKE